MVTIVSPPRSAAERCLLGNASYMLGICLSQFIITRRVGYGGGDSDADGTTIGHRGVLNSPRDVPGHWRSSRIPHKEVDQPCRRGPRNAGFSWPYLSRGIALASSWRRRTYFSFPSPTGNTSCCSG